MFWEKLEGFKLDFRITLTIALIILVLIYIHFDKMNKKLKDAEITIENYSCSIDKLVKITYIKELEQLNINNLDKNICTIDIKNDINKTDEVKILALLCSDLNIKIEHLRINSLFLTCLKSKCFSALIIDDNKITIASQDFEFLLVLHKKISDILKDEFSHNVE
ncbi:TPA: hypothetical protein LA460_000291 [Clostridium botulinum]|nr:hypothetical protein [Clostridium botulinum]